MRIEYRMPLSEIFLDLVAELNFLRGVPAAGLDPDRKEQDYLRVSTSLRGDIRGTLGLSVPRELAGEMAANILGLDPVDALESRVLTDGLRQLLDQVRSRLLDRLDDRVADCAAGSSPGRRPGVARDDAADGDADGDAEDVRRARADTLGFLLDDYPVFLDFRTAGACD